MKFLKTVASEVFREKRSEQLYIFLLIGSIFLFASTAYAPWVFADETISFSSNATNDQNGIGSGTTALAMPFTPASSWDTAVLHLLVHNVSNTANTTIKIEADVGGVPNDASVLGSISTASSGLAGCGAQTTFAAITTTLTGGTQYWVVITSSDTGSSGYLETCIRNTDPQDVAHKSGGTWTASGGGYYRFIGSLVLSSTGGGGTPLGGATSTPEQSQANLSTAFFLFLLSFFGMLWIIRKA